ncbi:MAG: hypothetical protein KAJ49_04235 [Arcobacteraceae bacterium]|nr:hypothetical protein [Arcobacteraceae bacterium]
MKVSKATNKLIPLSEKMGSKYSGLYYRMSKGKKVYYMSYRDEFGKVVRKKIVGDNLTATNAKDTLSDMIKSVKSIKDGVTPEIKKLIIK